PGLRWRGRPARTVRRGGLAGVLLIDRSLQYRRGGLGVEALHQLVPGSLAGLPDLPQSLAKVAGDLGKLLRPKEDQGDHQDQQELLRTDLEHRTTSDAAPILAPGSPNATGRPRRVDASVSPHVGSAARPPACGL